MMTASCPREEVRFSLLASLARGIWSWIVLATILAGLLTALFSAFALASLIEGFAKPGAQPVAAGIFRALQMVVLFAGVSWLFVSVIALPFGLIGCLMDRRRTIWVEHGQLCQKRALSTIRLPLNEARWQMSRLTSDRTGFFFPGKLVWVSKWPHAIVCGFTDEARAAWERFLQAAGVEQEHRIPKLRLALVFGVLHFGGMLSGALLGDLVHRRTGQPAWIFAGSLYGAIDGLLIAIVYFVAETGNAKDEKHAMSGFYPFLLASACLVLGLSMSLELGRSISILSALALSGANAMFGFVLGLWLCWRIKARARGA